MSSESPALIGLDWGTSSLRARLVRADGAIVEARDSDSGITRVADGRFEATFEREIGDWLARHPEVPVVASGMIGSRQGWLELPYVQCPAGAAEIAAKLTETRVASGRSVRFVPGVSYQDGAAVPDVIRGEETQILGALAELGGGGLCVLPGTHSKWAWVAEGRIVRFATFMTGEVFDVLHRHSILGRQMRPAASMDAASDTAAFERGVAYGLDACTANGGLLKRLFSTRTLGLFGQLDESGAHEYLSGLLIGAETREALACVRGAVNDAREQPVTVLGSAALAGRYLRALAQAGVPAVCGPADAASRGHLAIASAAGLLSD